MYRLAITFALFLVFQPGAAAVFTFSSLWPDGTARVSGQGCGLEPRDSTSNEVDISCESASMSTAAPGSIPDCPAHDPTKWHGLVERESTGAIVDRNGFPVSGCSAPAVDCVPYSATNAPAVLAFLNANSNPALGTFSEGDVADPATGQSLIRFPN